MYREQSENAGYESLSSCNSKHVISETITFVEILNIAYCKSNDRNYSMRLMLTEIAPMRLFVER
jgi:hypothetical protein